MQQVDEAVPVLASMDKDPTFRKAVSSLKAVHPPRNPTNKTLPANLTKPKPEAPVAQAVAISPCFGHVHGGNIANALWLLIIVSLPTCLYISKTLPANLFKSAVQAVPSCSTWPACSNHCRKQALGQPISDSRADCCTYTRVYDIASHSDETCP